MCPIEEATWDSPVNSTAKGIWCELLYSFNDFPNPNIPMSYLMTEHWECPESYLICLIASLKLLLRCGFKFWSLGNHFHAVWELPYMQSTGQVKSQYSPYEQVDLSTWLNQLIRIENRAFLPENLATLLMLTALATVKKSLTPVSPLPSSWEWPFGSKVYPSYHIPYGLELELWPNFLTFTIENSPSMIQLTS